jgi:XTP/dITP diphosphohydrolase
MKLVYIATSNKNKALSIKRGLATYGIMAKHVVLDIPEPRSYDIREIASAKAVYAYKKLGKPCIVLDSGFFISSIGGFPRTFVNYALETVGIGGILKLVEGKRRNCEFRDCMAYCDGVKKPILFESKEKGMLARKPLGTSKSYQWSSLFRIFIPKGTGKTLAQMGKQDYLRWYGGKSRNHYMKMFAAWYLKK